MRLLSNGVGLALAAGLFLAGCSTFGPTGQQQLDPEERTTGAEGSYSPFNWGPKNFDGLTAGRVIYPAGPPAAAVADDGEGAKPAPGSVVVAEFLSGKEAEDAEIVFEAPGGRKVIYRVNGLRAFEGQLARAEVEKALASELGDVIEKVAPEVKTSVIDAVCLLVTKAPCR